MVGVVVWFAGSSRLIGNTLSRQLILYIILMDSPDNTGLSTSLFRDHHDTLVILTTRQPLNYESTKKTNLN